MGSKYKKSLEIEWAGKGLSDIRKRTKQIQTDINLSEVIKGKYKRRSK